MLLKKVIFAFFILLIALQASSQNDIETDPIQLQIKKIFALPDDTNKVIELNNFIWKIYYYDSLNTAKIAQKSIDLSKKLQYVKGEATALKNWAAYYFVNAHYKTAMDLYQQSLQLYDSIGFKKGIAIDYNNIGNVYYQIGDWKNALSNYYKSLELREEIKDSVGIGRIYISMGQLFSVLEDYKDSSITYFNKALTIFKNLDSKRDIASIYLNIANFYYSQFQRENDSISFNKTIKYAKKTIEISQKNQILRLEASASEVLGLLYMTVGQNDSALYYFNRSLKIRKKSNNTFGIISSYMNLGKYYFAIKNYRKAEEYLKKALNLSIQIKTEQLSRDLYNYLAEVYYATGNYKLAFKHLQHYYKLKDSLENQENLKQLTRLSMQYEFDKKQKILELEQQKKDELHQKQLEKQKLVTTFFIFAFILMVILAVVILRSLRQKKIANELLKQKNHEINIQKEEIEAQRDEIESQRNFLEKQNKEIKASISYAMRIQRAVLTPRSFFEKNFKDYFILYKPRDIVSGDFYWGMEIGNKIFVTAADCTGHGVPGAFMSMLGISLLRQIVTEGYDNDPEKLTSAFVLNRLRDMVVLALGHGDTENVQQEGMDLGFVIIDKITQKLNFAGAYNPLIIIRNNEAIKIKADRMPVGYHFRKMDIPFTDNFFNLQENDRIFMFSDGFIDQFGGDEGKKFSINALVQVLLDNNFHKINEFENILENVYQNWTGENYRQLDDILVMGFQF